MFAPRCLFDCVRAAAVASIVLSLATACTPGTGGQSAGSLSPDGTAADSASFVTRLGVDTVAIERVVYARRRVEADVLLRVPATTRTRYTLDLSPARELARLEAVTADPRASDGAPMRREVITRVGDSLRVETTASGQVRTRLVAATDMRVLPFIDVVHWPFELALTRVRAAGQARTGQPLLAGSRVTNFPLADLGRVRLTARPLAEPVEVFTIAANSEGAGGVLRLQWDRTELVAPFRMRAP